MKDALKKVVTLTAASGTVPGKILSITEQNTVPGPRPMARMQREMVMSASQVPVAVGELVFTVNITLRQMLAQ